MILFIVFNYLQLQKDLLRENIDVLLFLSLIHVHTWKESNDNIAKKFDDHFQFYHNIDDLNSKIRYPN